MQALSRHNKGYKYILVVTDVLSKKVWYHPLKSKRPAEVVVGFKKLFKEAKPKLLFTDFGTEFYNATVKALLDRHGIKLYSTYSGVKASQAERAIRTLKENLTKVFYYRGSKKYIDVLQQLAQKYNSTRHSSTKIAPNDVNKENEQVVFNRLFGNQKTTKPRYSVGTTSGRSWLKIYSRKVTPLGLQMRYLKSLNLNQGRQPCITWKTWLVSL